VDCVSISKGELERGGGHGERKSEPSKGTHDLFLSATYLAQCSFRQALWDGESQNTEEGVWRPDAIIRTHAGANVHRARRRELYSGQAWAVVGVVFRA
jgi:hypothetical protein